MEVFSSGPSNGTLEVLVYLQQRIGFSTAFIGNNVASEESPQCTHRGLKQAADLSHFSAQQLNTRYLSPAEIGRNTTLTEESVDSDITKFIILQASIRRKPDCHNCDRCYLLHNDLKGSEYVFRYIPFAEF